MNSPFIFSEAPSTFRDAGSLLVRIPRGIRSKEKLFCIYRDGLRLPKYFGWNWDALDECLRDLSWLPATQPIAIVHEDFTFGSGGHNRAIYLDLLKEIVQHWSATSERKFQIILPTSLRDDLEA